MRPSNSGARRLLTLRRPDLLIRALPCRFRPTAAHASRSIVAIARKSNPPHGPRGTQNAGQLAQGVPGVRPTVSQNEARPALPRRSQRSLAEADDELARHQRGRKRCESTDADSSAGAVSRDRGPAPSQEQARIGAPRGGVGAIRNTKGRDPRAFGGSHRRVNSGWFVKAGVLPAKRIEAELVGGVRLKGRRGRGARR